MVDPRSFELSIDGAVATISMLPLVDAFALDPPADVHVELPDALNALRVDDDVRVIVLTGIHDGAFLVTPPVEYYTTSRAEARLAEPYGAWRVGGGVVRCLQAMTEIEKPVVAKVNGDAIGFGQSLMLASDLIVAREDALVADVHLGMGDVVDGAGQAVGLPFGVVPGDGAGSLAPLYMTPTEAKEYLMLGRTRTAADLAAARIVNRAVPAADLDAVTGEFVSGLLRRSAFALAWTKRVLNRHVAQQLNLTMDAALAYEQLNFAQLKLLGFAADPTSLGRPPAP